SSESRYQRAAEAARVGVWDLNLDTNELYLAPNLKELLGYKDEELDDNLENWNALVHPEDKEKVIAATKAHIEGKTPKYQVEARRRHKDGHYLWFLAQGIALRDETGKAYRLTGSDTDISQHKEMEAELRHSEEKYRSLLENANDIIYSHDLQGRYLTINRAGEQITGYTREEILGGLNMAEVVAPEHLEMAKQMIRKKLENPQPTVYEIDIITKTGKRLTLELSTRISFRDGKPIAIEGVARDITERKQIEKEKSYLAEQIEKQRRHLQEMVASVPGVVWEAWGEPDEAGQRIDFVSNYVERMLGYTVEEWLSTPNFWLTIVHPEDKERAAQEALKKFKSGGGISRFRWMTKDGKSLWVEAHSVTIYDEAGNPVGMRGVTMDISERRQKEEIERFLAEASTTLASSLDYETTLSTVAQLAVPHFADWCAVDILGEDETLKRLAVAHVEPEKVEWAKEIHAKYPPRPDEPQGLYNVLRTGQSEFYPNIPDEMLVQGAYDEDHLKLMREIGFRSAMVVPLKIRDEVFGAITFVNTETRYHTREDLTVAEDLASRAALAVENARLFRIEQQTRRVAERTSSHLARLQAVSEALSQALTPKQVAGAVIEQAINSLGAHAGTVVSFNEQSAILEIIDTIGFPKDVAEKWKHFPLGKNVPLADAVRQKMPILVDSFDNFHERYPDLGLLSTITGSKALVAFPLIIEGRTIGALGLSFKTEQKFNEDDRAFMLALAQQCAQALERARLYENEQQLRAEAEAANRTKDEFLATVSHELRTPLNAIVGWSSLLKSSKLDGEGTIRAIETIERNGRMQAQIIEDLLDVSRIITGKLHLETHPVELDSIIQTTLETIHPTADSKNIKITTDIEKVSPILGDPSRLQQVLWNLLSNAIKFTPKDGEIEVKMRQANSSAQISVKDNGQGIAPEFLPFVFDRFRQADGTTTRTHGGLGLGLSIVRHLVEMHGGSVSAESAGLNKGATFTINLPVMAVRKIDTESPAQIETGDFQYDCADALEGLRILIVDDEKDARLLLTTIIEDCGAETKSAESAAEALEILKEFNPDILISDIGMPGEDGYSLIRKVRALEANGKRIPAIALTAYAREEDRMRALLAGFQVHVAKPVNPVELIAVIGGLAGLRKREKG
ncbi:MAG TPA: PAS domain S-box protein, partial [Pyrinomonadaceae bacterium]|nr:PAS domain S-box protein [Pyrinomonadaceae bacterium]